MSTFFANYPGGTSTGSSGGGGGGNSVVIDTYTLTPTDIANGGVILSKIPTVANKVVVLVNQAPGQEYNVDYIIDSSLAPGQTLDWSGRGLQPELASGDFLTAIYY